MSRSDAPGAAPSLPLWRVERVLYDADGLLVVDKPAGLVVHGGDEELADDCVSRLRAWRQAEGRSGDLFVHQRLDLATSGVLFFLTDRSLNPRYARAMEAHEIERTYLAVVEASPFLNQTALASERGASFFGGKGGAPTGRGARARGRGTSAPGRGSQGARLQPEAARRVSARALPLEASASVELFLLHERGRTRVVTEQTPGAKRALSHYRLIEQRGARALVEVSLSTGRPHQIRATFAHLGVPVVGDRLYGGAPHHRLMLHAASIEKGPLPRRFEARPPAEFDDPWAPESSEPFPEPGGARSSSVDPEQLTSLVVDAALKRARLAEQTAAYRLMNGAPDGLPGCTIDAYGAYACINPTESILDEQTLAQLGEGLLGLGFAGVYVKHRVRADLRKENAGELAPEHPLAGKRAPDEFSIDEHGMKLLIQLHEGLSTGLFVDMRHARKKVRGFAGEYQPARLLNLFSYTCSFSVAAALGGATTTSVDLSGRALSVGRMNFELNGLDPAEHRFFKEDALKYLKKAQRRGEEYDLIVLDPPSFATVGRGTFSVAAHYGQVVRDCFALLAPGGRLLCVTNHRKTSEARLVRIVDEVAREAGRGLRSLRALPSAPDCPPHASGPSPSKAVLAQLI